ncbi:MAG: AAA family ATPase [Planctomycetaceae bacterium]|nr:AAA family ATPase [Planctomycetaceae bacterium]
MHFRIQEPESMSKLSPTEYLEQLKRNSPQQNKSVAEPKPASEPADVGENLLFDSILSGPRQGAQASKSNLGEKRISNLLDRVNSLLSEGGAGNKDAFYPHAPRSLQATKLSEDDIEKLVFKYLLTKGVATGRKISDQIKVSFTLIDPLLQRWKAEQFLDLRNSAEMGDYYYGITDKARDRARRYAEECSYCGAAPVDFSDYLEAMEKQSIAHQSVSEEDLKRAFQDLLISPNLLDKLGPAINSGRGMFLFGEPGNGKTSIAERVTSCFGSTIWIPRSLLIDGDIVRLFDPGLHEVAESNDVDAAILASADPRWVEIVRPTVIAGGELTMAELEISQNQMTRVCEAPLQLKSNCGTLVIDDFGRQRMPVDELLNRWIVPLEKRYDFLNMPSGKKIRVPFDQLIVFSTNLEPKDLVDGAFLRRIPYKIEALDPTEEQFIKLFEIMAPKFGMEFDRQAIDYLVETHYRKVNRPFRACQPRDLLLQVRNFCVYKGKKAVMSPQAFDFAVENYFSVM